MKWFKRLVKDYLCFVLIYLNNNSLKAIILLFKLLDLWIIIKEINKNIRKIIGYILIIYDEKNTEY